MSTIKSNAELVIDKPRYYRMVIGDIEAGIKRNKLAIANGEDRDGRLAYRNFWLLGQVEECQRELSLLDGKRWTYDPS